MQLVMRRNASLLSKTETACVSHRRLGWRVRLLPLISERTQGRFCSGTVDLLGCGLGRRTER
jgi:hypothetical protein